MTSSIIKHLIHCFFLLSVVGFTLKSVVIVQSGLSVYWHEYTNSFSFILSMIRFTVFLPLPSFICNFLGLCFYNTFPEKVVLKKNILLAPSICFRVVTRGNFPALVKENAVRNINTCFNVGLKNFVVEVVTDKLIDMPKQQNIREIVVPEEYRSKTNALFKARALQYCLEENVNLLNPNDWIVHLDEETILSNNCVRGIINFVMEGKHFFGQGLIIYAHEKGQNLMTTLFDSFRVGSDLGAIRFSLKALNKPIMSWKGSFIVANVRKIK